MSKHYETLAHAKSRLRSFGQRWEAEGERPIKPNRIPDNPADEDPRAEHYRQDAEGTAKLLHESARIAKAFKVEVPSVNIALQALCCYDYEAVRAVLYAALAEITELQQIDANGKPAVSTGYHHPILQLSDELRADAKTRKHWTRPKIADEYYKRLPGPLKQEEKLSTGQRSEELQARALKTKYIDILRNHKSQLLYP